MSTKFASDDPDTDRLLRIVAWTLARFFGYSDAAAERALLSFYARWHSPGWGDDFYHHEGAFRSAALIHYSEINGGSTDFGRFFEWYREQDFDAAEREAQEYFREHYFKKEWSA